MAKDELFKPTFQQKSKTLKLLFDKGITDEKDLAPYLDPDTAEYEQMVNDISDKLNFTSLRYNRIDDLIAATGISECDLCTYCWNGKK